MWIRTNPPFLSDILLTSHAEKMREKNLSQNSFQLESFERSPCFLRAIRNCEWKVSSGNRRLARLVVRFTQMHIIRLNSRTEKRRVIAYNCMFKPQIFTLTNLSGVKPRQDLGQNGVEDMIQLTWVNKIYYYTLISVIVTSLNLNEFQGFERGVVTMEFEDPLRQGINLRT